MLQERGKKNEHENPLRVARFSELFRLGLLYSEIGLLVPEKFDPDVPSYRSLSFMGQNVQDDPTLTLRQIPQEPNPHENCSFHMC